MDTVIPSIRRETNTNHRKDQLTISEGKYTKALIHLQDVMVNCPEGEALEKYLDEKPSDNPKFQDLLKRTLSTYARDDARKGLSVVLTTLK